MPSPHTGSQLWRTDSDEMLTRYLLAERRPSTSIRRRARHGGRARLSQTVPEKVLVAGDWHVNLDWALEVVDELPELLPEESPRLILHAGDFGVFAHWKSEHFLNELDTALAEADAQLLFVDGNHEDTTHLRSYVRGAGTRDAVAIRERIAWLRRGYRWSWHGRTWLALGGGVSVDRVMRTRGVDWWPQEQITAAQVKRVIADGPADVMLCHDAPSSVPLALPEPPNWWHVDDLRRSQRHREVLQSVVDQVRPAYLIHGHYHLYHHTEVPMAHGMVTVTGFDRDQKPGLVAQTKTLAVAREQPQPAWRSGTTHRVLDVRTMQFAAA